MQLEEDTVAEHSVQEAIKLRQTLIATNAFCVSQIGYLNNSENHIKLPAVKHQAIYNYFVGRS